MIKIINKTDIDFQGKRRLALTISGILIFIGLVSLILHGGPNYSIDFEGGLAILIRFDPESNNSQPITEQLIRESLAKVNLGNSEVKMSRSAEGEDLMIRIEEEGRLKPPEALIRAKLEEKLPTQWTMVSDDKLNGNDLPDLSGVSYVAVSTAASKKELQNILDEIEVNNPKLIKHTAIDGSVIWLLTGEGKDAVGRLKKVINEDYPNHPFEIRSIDRVGPRIGSELRIQALLSIFAALGLIIVYLSWRFEFLFGVAAVIALFHDVLITLGLFSLLDLEISLTVVGAFLTLVGYSLNDTIVVFDRIRENLKRYKDKLSYAEVINISINQNLSRTIITSATTLIVVLILFLMGGEVLHGFALALLVGIIVGTYSSIYIASPILIEWAERTGIIAGKKKQQLSTKRK